MHSIKGRQGFRKSFLTAFSEPLVTSIPGVRPVRHCFGLAQDLCNVHAIQTLHQLQQVERYSASRWSIETSDLKTGSHDLFATRSRLSTHSSKHSARMSSLDKFTPELVGPTTSTSLNQGTRHCHRAQQLELIVAALTTKMIHHA